LLASNATFLIVFDPSNGSQNLEQKIFKTEVIEESIKNNLYRTFCMPIFKEINNINIFPMWKLQNNFGSTSGGNESSDYIRKIGEHFVSFIHKLD